MDAKAELKRALKEYHGSILMVCHEPDFYEDWVTDVWDCSKWTSWAKPDTGGISPRILFNRVVFPIPLAPISAILLLRSMDRSKGTERGSKPS